MDLKQIAEIHELSREQFSSTKEFYEFLMYQMQSHMIEIDDLKTNGDPHYKHEIADLAILAKLLADCEGADNNIFCERYGRFRDKIRENK